jgi:hypothetical protein
MLNFNSDEWHADETVVKINGVKHYIWFIVDAETRFVLGFHLSPHRNSPQVFALMNAVKNLGSTKAVVSDRYSAYKVPVKSVLGMMSNISVFKALKMTYPITLLSLSIINLRRGIIQNRDLTPLMLPII